jgi:hypothetical protein
MATTKHIILELRRDNQLLIDKLKNQQSLSERNYGDTQRRSSGGSGGKLVRSSRGERMEATLRNKLEEYQEVMDSLEAARLRKNSTADHK